MNPVPEFFERLRFHRVALLAITVLALAFTCLGAFGLIVLVGEAFNAAGSLQEATAFRWLVAATIATGVAFAGGVVFVMFRRPSEVDLARIIESRHPELRESLSTAVEIQSRLGGPQNALHAALFRDVERRTQDINFRIATLPRNAHPALVIGTIIASVLVSNFAMESVVMAKARFHYADLLRGEPTGLQVAPGSVDAPEGSDLAIAAEVKRWQRSASIDYRGPNGEIESYPMSMAGKAEFSFTWYALEESFDYRVRTPSLQTEWWTVTVFDPPEIEAIEIDITPPAYTGEPKLDFGRLLDLFAVEGSEVTFQLETGPGVETWLRLGEDETAFDGKISVIAEQTAEYQFRLRNAEGREAVTERYLLEVKPDEPPTVAIIDPGADSKAVLDDIVPLEVYGADDYGVSRVAVELSVSGLPRRPIEAFSATEGFPAEHTALPVIEVGRLGVEFGDVITYYARAWDNREPEPQVSRSEVYFIEVVENIDGPEQEDGASGGGGEGGQQEKDVDIRAIITELKRLIRLGFAVDAETGERRQVGSQELGAGLATLATESQGILAEIGGVLGRIEEGYPYELFLDAIYRMVDAEERANANEPGEAIPPMQESMSLLIRLEKYLEALFPPQPQSGGGGGGQSSPSEGGEQESEESEGQSGMSIADMQEALEEINRLSDEQAAMNRRFERAASTMGESEREELQGMQESVARELAALTEELSALRQGTPVREAMRTAGGQMDQAAGAAGQGDSDRAGRAGFRARRSLMDAAGLLDERIRQEATGAIAGLAQQAERLSQGQQAAAADSRGAAASEAGAERKDALRQQQGAINEDWDRLQQEMERLSGDLGEVFPEAAESLERVARDAGEQNIDREMARAANALLYGRFERAAGSQSEAASGLQEIANQLDQAAGVLPGLSPGELRELLERVAQARRELATQAAASSEPGAGEAGEQPAAEQAQNGEGQGDSAGEQGQGEGQGRGEGQGEGEQVAQQGQPGPGEGQGQQPGEVPGESGPNGRGQGRGSPESEARLGQLGESLSQAGRALKDDSLVQLGSELRAPQRAEGEGEAGGTTPTALLDTAARVLQEYLRQEIGDQRLRFNREGGPPPEKYRELVEEYFRDLAEEPRR